MSDWIRYRNYIEMVHNQIPFRFGLAAIYDCPVLTLSLTLSPFHADLPITVQCRHGSAQRK